MYFYLLIASTNIDRERTTCSKKFDICPGLAIFVINVCIKH